MGLFVFFSFGGMAIMAMLSGWAADRLIGRGHQPRDRAKVVHHRGFAVACTELIGARATSLETALIFAVVSLSGLGLGHGQLLGAHADAHPGRGHRADFRNSKLPCSFAGIVAPILTGWLLQKTGSYEAPMMAILVVLVVGVFCYLFLIREMYAPKADAVG